MTSDVNRLPDQRSGILVLVLSECQGSQKTSSNVTEKKERGWIVFTKQQSCDDSCTILMIIGEKHDMGFDMHLSDVVKCFIPCSGAISSLSFLVLLKKRVSKRKKKHTWAT